MVAMVMQSAWSYRNHGDWLLSILCIRNFAFHCTSYFQYNSKTYQRILRFILHLLLFSLDVLMFLIWILMIQWKIQLFFKVAIGFWPNYKTFLVKY
jgi:hypothetical protein